MHIKVENQFVPLGLILFTLISLLVPHHFPLTLSTFQPPLPSSSAARAQSPKCRNQLRVSAVAPVPSRR